MRQTIFKEVNFQSRVTSREIVDYDSMLLQYLQKRTSSHLAFKTDVKKVDSFSVNQSVEYLRHTYIPLARLTV